ncbi:MAG: TolC family protein [Bacteroidetes bacterium]|nr:TolC family protein [Bacteroidota bacterium]MCY4205780.1 TolC family protein [Bacteroidota bacterium]
MKFIRSTGTVCVGLLFLFILPLQVFSQDLSDAPTDTLSSLDDLLIEARANNLLLQASHLETQALALRSGQVSAFPDPSVRIIYQPAPVLTARGAQRSQWSIEQEIPYPGKLRLLASIADQTAEIQGFDTATLEDALLLQVKQAYFTLYRIQQQELRILSFKERLQKFEEISTARYEVGTGTQQAILKTQLERNSLSRLQLELSTEGHAAAEVLSNLLNRPISTESIVTIKAPPNIQSNVMALVEIALSHRPEANALETATKRADEKILLARKQFRPDFRLGVTYFDISRTDILSTATGRDALGIAATIRIPLQRERRRAQLEEERVRRSHVYVRQEALQTAITARITDLVHQLREKAQQLELLREALIPQAEIALQSTLSSYSTGGTNFLDLLDSERTLFSLHMSYDDTFTRYLLATAELERALGVGSLTDLTAY